MGSAGLGQIGIALEPTANPGEQTLLAYTAIIASMSLTTQPNTLFGNAGSRLIFRVYGNTATGTLSVAGKDQNGNAISETCQAIPIFPANSQSQEVGDYEYVTKNIFSTVNASGITTTGATNGLISVQAVQAAKYLVPGVFKAKDTYDRNKPKEHRGLPSAVTQNTQLIKKVTVDELSMELYPESFMWMPYMMTNSAPASTTTTPSTPTACLAATAVSGSPLSLTTQPLTPGQRLQLVVAASTLIGSIVLTGKDINGNAQSETIQCGLTGAANGNGTYYSSFVYSAINASGIAVTGLTTGTLAVNGINAWNYTFLPSLNTYSADVEWFTGTDSESVPFIVLDETSLEFSPSKGWSVSAKGIAQDKLPIGDRSLTNLSTNNIAVLSQPLDIPQSGWQTNVYFDLITATPGTTQYLNLLDAKITFKTPVEGIWPAVNKQYYQRVYKGQIETTVEATIDLTDLIQMENFRKNNKMYVNIQLLGPQIGATTWKTITITLPCHYEDFDITSTPDMKHVEGKLKFQCAYDSGISGEYRIQIIDQQPPVYPS